MNDQPTLLVGRVPHVGSNYVVLGKTRIELHEEQSSAGFGLGYSAAVMAVTVDGKLIAGRIVRPQIAHQTRISPW
jgi:hypothetical protein